MNKCETLDFMFPIKADIFYPIVEQAVYGNVKKQWIQDRTIAINVNSAGSASKEEITPNINIKQEMLLVGRAKTDLRMSSRQDRLSITNVIISNICDKYGNSIYNETAGPRAGKPTIFEIATIDPYLGPFGKVEYYNLVLRRSENQAVDI